MGSFPGTLIDSEIQTIIILPGQFPSRPRPLFQSEVKCQPIDMEMTFFFPFLFYAIKSHFHKKGFALGLFLKVADFGSRKSLITSQTQKLPVVFRLF